MAKKNITQIRKRFITQPKQTIFLWEKVFESLWSGSVIFTQFVFFRFPLGPKTDPAFVGKLDPKMTIFRDLTKMFPELLDCNSN